MRTDEVRALYDRTMREWARPDGPGVRVERDGPLVRQVGGPDDWNGVVWSSPDLDAAGADAAIAAQIGHCAALGLPEFEWKLYAHDGPADLGDRLRAAGFVPEPPETLLVAPAELLSGPVALPDGVTLRPVTDAAGAELMARAHERAFGTDGSRLLHQMVRRLEEAPEDFVAVMAVDGDGEPVCSGRMELYPGTGFAGLWGGGTVAEWRGKGVYRALVTYRARIAAERGYHYLQVDASDMSAPILARLGFTALGTTTPYVYRAGR
ncbi:Acetyltransferase (GNAT) domain-containing protein [Streptomyces sp. Ncost-T6T-1]|uniref:GNAT family N-acetyltransferase n=1 Tax=Streptomyces sp. Ncost-T6T-1 TaxID=1100828 RepID=UPI00080584BE|nr:GNAT family N-acetyltransferase [Streptomyces sp. Ncost-T6T-1]SBV02499.1 Acetyltransferase (GNAT) domain-containing protein [Streptomyces sp. Ncost-T6T-1]